MIPFNPFSGLTAKIYGGVAVAALAFAAVQTVRIEGFLFIHGYKQDVADRDAKIAAMSKASDEAWMLAQKQVAETEAHYTKLAKENVRVETEIRTVYRDRAGAYADRMRADQVCRAPATPTSGGDPAPLGDRPGPDAVVLGRADFDILVGNTARLEAVHNWAEELIVTGAAAVVSN